MISSARYRLQIMQRNCAAARLEETWLALLVAACLVTLTAGQGATSPSWTNPSPVDADIYLTAYIGEEVSFEVQAEARGPLNAQLTLEELIPWEITLMVDEDPGLPNVAVITGPRKTADYFFAADNVTRLDKPAFTSYLAISWAPLCTQTRAYTVSLTASNAEGAVSKRFHINVIAPSPEIVDFDYSPITTRIGCPINVTAVAREGSDLIRDAGFAAYGTFVTHSLTRTDLRGQTRALPELLGLQFREVRNNNVWGGSSGIVTWQPERGQEAAVYTVCFHMQDECLTAEVATACIDITVVKCQRCLVAGESLESIAKEYKSDFLSLFSFNVAMSNPDALSVGELINLGLHYRVRDQDSLHAIADRFFLTVDHILSVNPDIALDIEHGAILVPLPSGPENDVLCLMPPLCFVECEHGTACSLHPSVAGV